MSSNDLLPSRVPAESLLSNLFRRVIRYLAMQQDTALPENCLTELSRTARYTTGGKALLFLSESEQEMEDMAKLIIYTQNWVYLLS